MKEKIASDSPLHSGFPEMLQAAAFACAKKRIRGRMRQLLLTILGE
jgi:hypothetical protein